MASMRRIATMASMTAFRAFRSPADIVWILVLPVVLSLLIASWFSGAGPAMGEWVQRETPRGLQDPGEYLSVRGVFGIYLIFVLSALITRAVIIHRERKDGRLGRTLGCGVPYHEVVPAHVVSITLIGLVQAGIFLAVTGALGIPWLSAGWSALVVSLFGVLFAGAGIAIGIAGPIDDDFYRFATVAAPYFKLQIADN